MNNVQINPGEIIINFKNLKSGKLTFKELGLTNDQVNLKSGLLRLVFDFKGMKEKNYFQVPTIEVAYLENMSETHWICEFNGETILDKLDHHGNSTVLLLNRKELSRLENHHENGIILHAEFPQSVQIDTDQSYINFFK